jgi:hypothetical protein
MPFVSQAQRGLFHAVASGQTKKSGISRKTAKKMIGEDKPGKLPGHVKDGKPSRAQRWYGGDKD